MSDEQTTVQANVTGQLSLRGFGTHPENINRAGGPPKTHWWSELLAEEAEQMSEKMEGFKKKEVMAKKLIEQAEEGNLAAIREFGDRVQGKAGSSEDILKALGTMKKVAGFVIEFTHEGQSANTSSL